MPAPEPLRKLACLAVIAGVFAAGVWLRPAPPLAARIDLRLVPAPDLSPARPSSVWSAFRVGSESVQSRLGVRSESVQSTFRVGSESGDAIPPADAPSSVQELRTASLRGRTFDVPAPAVHRPPRVIDPPPGHLSRAFATASRETTGAFRIAGRALRSVF